MTVMGLDPGLTRTGWGIVTLRGNALKHLANGLISTVPAEPLPVRLTRLYRAIEELVKTFEPDLAAVEETFVNRNAAATLKLNHARTVAILVPALHGIAVESYAPNHVKKTVVGFGHAGKEQIHAMVKVLLPGVKISGADAADALAVAICHGHHASSHAKMKVGAAA
ncbi:MAG TPA: crossover junction endodeoxyribonuclease RuvC [Sphingomonadales bacterium]|nr:crossover junction endodeoxyribonuclease RuvC [Sphingomonadales bacterium]